MIYAHKILHIIYYIIIIPYTMIKPHIHTKYISIPNNVPTLTAYRQSMDKLVVINILLSRVNNFNIMPHFLTTGVGLGEFLETSARRFQTQVRSQPPQSLLSQ